MNNAKRALLGSWSTTALACLGIALPKCPLCVAAYLCLFGFSASSARAVAQLGFLLCLTAIGLCAFATALLVARRGRSLAASGGSQRASHCACRNATPKADTHSATQPLGLKPHC